MDKEWRASFKEKLDSHYAWPALYMFKFIVPHEKEQQVLDLFRQHETSSKPSKEGKYVSVTIKMMMPSSETVIGIYEQAYAIEGLIAL